MDKIIQDIENRKTKLYKLLEVENNTGLLNKWLKTELSYTSNAIEGNTLTRRETALIIEENITSSSKNLNEYLEARNHAEAFEYIIKLLKNDNLVINRDIILNIHRIILKGIDDSSAGFYRSAMVRISGSNTVLPNPLKLPKLMDEFNGWLLDSNFDLLNIFEVHYKLVSIHPFIDGNGRTARLLMNLLLMRNNYCPIIIRTIDRKRYLDSLEKYQTTGKSKEYYIFMLRCLKRSFETIINLLDIKITDRNNNKLLTIAKFAKLHDLPVSTVRYWIQIGKIKPASYTNSGYMLFDRKQKIYKKQYKIPRRSTK